MKADLELPAFLSVLMLGGVLSLEDMIAKIIEMDKRARDITAEAQKDKLDFEKKVIEKKENIKSDYLERAKKRIAINQESAQKKSDAELKLVEERNNAVIARLDSAYEQNCDKWVDEIVARVVDG